MIPAILCLVVAISDGDTLKARCGEPGAGCGQSRRWRRGSGGSDRENRMER